MSEREAIILLARAIVKLRFGGREQAVDIAQKVIDGFSAETPNTIGLASGGDREV